MADFMDEMNKFMYERITGKSYDGYVNYLKEIGFALEVPTSEKKKTCETRELDYGTRK